jgi:Viral BACON domain
MQLSTTVLNFRTTLGVNPTAQTLTITNNGGAKLIWGVGTPSATWLSVSPTTGHDGAGKSSPVTFNVNVASLAAGPYNATAVITPLIGTAVTVTVNLTISATLRVTNGQKRTDPMKSSKNLRRDKDV